MEKAVCDLSCSAMTAIMSTTQANLSDRRKNIIPSRVQGYEVFAHIARFPPAPLTDGPPRGKIPTNRRGSISCGGPRWRFAQFVITTLQDISFGDIYVRSGSF